MVLRLSGTGTLPVLTNGLGYTGVFPGVIPSGYGICRRRISQRRSSQLSFRGARSTRGFLRFIPTPPWRTRDLLLLFPVPHPSPQRKRSFRVKKSRLGPSFLYLT